MSLNLKWSNGLSIVVYRVHDNSESIDRMSLQWKSIHLIQL